MIRIFCELPADLQNAFIPLTHRQTLRYDQVNTAQWDRIKDQAMLKGRSFYAFLMMHEAPPAKKNITGKWEELGTYKSLFTLWKISPE